MTRKPLDTKERKSWLRLCRTQRVGPVAFRELIRRYGAPDEALAALPDLARRGGGQPLTPPPLKQIDEEIKLLEDKGGRFIALCEPDYPETLAAIEDAPPVIAVIGQVSLLHKPSVGIVGSRNASLSGRKMAERLAQDLGTVGYVIVSGLARGIDASAHAKALGTGTVAVLAGGVDMVYPEENRGLYEQIAENGCLLSDQPMRAEPRANLFPRRNRIISGLSLGVVVVEAARQSGSLITARMALEQGREVFAVPGSPLDPRANGANDLIRQGAVLTETAADVEEHLKRQRDFFSEPPPTGYDPPPLSLDPQSMAAARNKIIDNLSTCPVTVDELVRGCQLSVPFVLTVLLELELAGRLERHPGHQVSLIG